MFISTKKSDITRSNNNEKSQIKTNKNLYQPQIVQPQQQKQKAPSAINTNENNLVPKRNVLTSNANSNINAKQTAALVEVVVQTRTASSSNQNQIQNTITTTNIISSNRKSSNANKQVITANNNNANLQQK